MKKYFYILLGTFLIICTMIYFRIYMIDSALQNKIQLFYNDNKTCKLQDIKAKYYAPIQEKNYAGFYQKAFTIEDTIQNNNLSIVKLRDNFITLLDQWEIHKDIFQDDNYQKIKEFTVGYKQVFSILESIPVSNRCRFDIVFEQGYLAELPHLEPLNRFSKMSFLRFLLFVKEGNAVKALEYMDIQLALINALNEEPCLTSFVVADEIFGNFLLSYQWFMNKLPITEKEVAHIKKSINSLRRVNLDIYVYSDLAWYLDFAKNYVWYDGRSITFSDKLLGTYPKEIIANLNDYGRALVILQENLSNIEKFNKLLKASNIVRSAFTSVIRYHEKIDLLQTMIMIEEYNLTHKHLPETLQDLPQKAPNNMYTQQPFFYRKFSENNYQLANFSTSFTKEKQIEKVILNIGRVIN